MLAVGNLLKKAREHSGKQIEEIAQTIRIKPEYLYKIEENDFSSFNSSTFVKGFIRSYASYLGLDAENIVALFRRQIGEEDVPLKAKKTLVRSKSVVISPTTIISVAIVLFFVGLFAFLLSQFYKLQQPPAFAVTQPGQDLITVDDSSYEIKGYTEENTQVTINNTPLTLRDDSTFALTVQLKNGTNIFTFDAWKKNIDGRHTTKVLTVVYKPEGGSTLTPTDVLGQTTTPTNKGGKEIPVVLKLSADAWIQVVADSTQKAVGIKSKGYELTFNAKKAFDVTTGKPNSSTITVNGKATSWRIKNGVGSLVCTYKDDIADWKCN